MKGPKFNESEGDHLTSGYYAVRRLILKKQLSDQTFNV